MMNENIFSAENFAAETVISEKERLKEEKKAERARIKTEKERLKAERAAERARLKEERDTANAVRKKALELLANAGLAKETERALRTEIGKEKKPDALEAYCVKIVSLAEEIEFNRLKNRFLVELRTCPACHGEVEKRIRGALEQVSDKAGLTALTEAASAELAGLKRNFTDRRLYRIENTRGTRVSFWAEDGSLRFLDNRAGKYRISEGHIEINESTFRFLRYSDYPQLFNS